MKKGEIRNYPTPPLTIKQTELIIQNNQIG